MAVDNPSIPQNTVLSYIESHPLYAVVAVVVVGLIVGSMIKKKASDTTQQSTTQQSTTQTPTTLPSGINPLTGQPYGGSSYTYASGNNIGALFGSGGGSYNGGINPLTGLPYTDQSGLINPYTGQPTVYVPTGTQFTTNNVGAQFTGQPGNVTVNASNQITSPPTIAPSTPIVNKPVPPVSQPPTVNPIPVKQPPATPPPQKSVTWTGSYTVGSGDTLVGIANKITTQLRQAGAPATTVVTYQQLYTNNRSVIDNTAHMHGSPIAGGPQNNIFPGEVLRVPVYA